MTFIRNFGDPDPSDTSRYHEAIDIDGFKGLRLISNIAEAGKNVSQFGNDEMGWHQDRWIDAFPPPATALHGVEVTRNGGRTALANLCEAYDACPRIWSRGSNRCCAHRRDGFDPSERRLLYGTPIVGSTVL